MPAADLEAPPSATPQPAPSPQSPQLPSRRSGLDEALSKLPGTAVQLYALHLLSRSLLAAMSSCADDRWRWVLLGFVVVVVPTFAWSAFDLARQFLGKRS